MISDREKAVLRELQGDIPVEPRPFLRMAEALNMTEREVLDCIRNLTERGVIRRFGVTVRHQLTGFDANAMAAWRVDPERLEQVADIMVSLPQVTHCYHRPPVGDWRYNLFCMIHGSSRAECLRTAREIARRGGLDEYELLFSEEEFKKTSMRYF